MRRAHWLLVEDNEAEVELAREALSHLKELDLTVATSGGEALRRLRDESCGVTAPGLVLLDLNLPGVSGLEVLSQVRAEERLRHIPVIVLSSSDHAHDIEMVYRAGANSYLTKPIHHAEFVSMIREITRYWLTVARLPDQS
jgi:two-component system, chemotaxis family, response regulator Rcp1